MGYSVLNGCVHPLLARLYGEEEAEKQCSPEVTDDSKETDTIEQIHIILTEAVTAHTRSPQTQSRQYPSIEKRKWTQIPTPNQATVVDSCQQKEN